MWEVQRGVHWLEEVRGGNVYLLAMDEGLTLVDSGGKGMADAIEAQMREGGYAPSDLRSIVLTHGHAGHTGSAAELARRSSAQVLAHREEVPYIQREAALPATGVLARLAGWIGGRVLRPEPCTVNGMLEYGDWLESLGGLQVIHAPGHTPGSICLYQPERRLLFCGDALLNANPLTGTPGLRMPLALITVDPAQARESVRKLAALPLEVLCPGHGEPIMEGAGERIRALDA